MGQTGRVVTSQQARLQPKRLFYAATEHCAVARVPSSPVEQAPVHNGQSGSQALSQNPSLESNPQKRSPAPAKRNKPLCCLLLVACCCLSLTAGSWLMRCTASAEPPHASSIQHPPQHPDAPQCNSPSMLYPHSAASSCQAEAGVAGVAGHAGHAGRDELDGALGKLTIGTFSSSVFESPVQRAPSSPSLPRGFSRCGCAAPHPTVRRPPRQPPSRLPLDWDGRYRRQRRGGRGTTEPSWTRPVSPTANRLEGSRC